MSPPARHGLPIDMHVSAVDIVDIEADTTYLRCTTTVWVQEDADNLVPHRYQAQLIWFNGDLVSPIRGFKRPPSFMADRTAKDPQVASLVKSKEKPFLIVQLAKEAKVTQAFDECKKEQPVGKKACKI